MTTPPAAAERVDRVTELMDSLVAGVAQLTTSDDWLRWLDVARRFHRYSFWNTVAILTQQPDATQVAGYQRWKTLGRRGPRQSARSVDLFAPDLMSERRKGADRCAVTAIESTSFCASFCPGTQQTAPPRTRGGSVAAS